MTTYRDKLGMGLGAIVLALASIAAFAFGVINFRQRMAFEIPEDGATWLVQNQAIQAAYVAPNSPADRAGIKTGDNLVAINGVPVHRAVDVAKRLWDLGVWSKAAYSLERSGREFQASVVVAPAPKPLGLENYFRAVGLVYLFVGLFILGRRWTASRAIHFYLFCLASFILFSFHYTGKLDPFDWEIYWCKVGAMLLAPALLVHFALLFPERGTEHRLLRRLGIACAYLVPAALLTIHINVATGWLGFAPSLLARIALDQLELAYLGLYFMLAAAIFVISCERAPNGLLRQQLKWVSGGTLASIAPFGLFYILPYSLGAAPRQWMNLSAVSLVLLPVCLAYAIVRYRLMDVDIIFKRGLAYTAATAGVIAVYAGMVALIGALFHTAVPTGLTGEIVAIVAAIFLFQPFRDWTQTRLDRYFYRDRLNYRRTLIEFGRTLTSEVHLEPMLASVLDRLSQTLLVDRLAIFLEDSEQSGQYRLARAIGAGAGQLASEPLNLAFLSPERPALQRGFLFYESPRAVRDVSGSERQTLERLDLNYFIPCRVRERTIAVLGLGKTVDGDFLTTEDVELLFTIAGYVAVALDNAQLYSSLEQKAEQIERLRDFSENVIESLNVGVLAVDLDGRVESWNTQVEQLTGVPRQEALSRLLDEVLPADLAAEIAAHSNQQRVTGIYRFLLQNRAGQILVVNVSVAPLLGKSGERVGRLILLDDITQRTRLEEQLVQNEKLSSLGLLAAGVAHEVNTPLAVIANYIQILAKQLPEEDPRHKLIDKIVKQTFRASEIVNHLLNFSRSGGSEFREVDLNQVIEETFSLVSHPFRTAHVQVVRNLDAGIPRVFGSSNRLQQVFLNLFMNARDAMPSGGMLEVRTFATNGSVEVEVADTGAGISRDHLSRIFDPFFTTKAAGRGTGLGLSVSYGIVKEHAGKIEVHSTPGRGTSFRLEFPAARKAVHA
jgi:two-component system, NtrC family, sensor kinase